MMRHDAQGIFWHDLPKVAARAKKGPRERGPMPPIPETGWKPPEEFPNLSSAKVISFDTETYDPELRTAGPGWARGKGHLIGASLAVEDGTSWYFPFRHESQTELNMDAEQVIRFLKYTLGRNIPKVGANLIYDVGWCRQEGIKVNGKLYDIQFAEALLNSETPDVSLDGLAERYLGRGKETSILYDWLASWLGGRATERQRENLYLSPPSLAGPYAEADAALPLAVLGHQWPAMANRGVLDLFDLECRLIPLLVDMRFKGAPVDINKAEQYYDELKIDLKASEERLKEIAGQPVNPNAGDSIRSAFIKLGIPIPEKVDKKTGERKPSFAAPLLEDIPHPLCEAILEHRRTAKVQNTFIKGYILNKNINGRIYCSFHPLKNEGHGARSGRFSSSDPNLQNIPVRTEIGRKVRDMFVATKGGRWRKGDYSQIEYRMLAHHAVGEGSEELRQTYRNNPDIDFHDNTIDMVYRLTRTVLDRRPAKNINFGLIYGMSEPKLIADLGISREEGKQLFDSYHRAAPYVRETMTAAANEVNRLGYVETILGRKSDFGLWTTKKYDPKAPSLSWDEACKLWGPYNIERAHTHKALNRKLQGGAADVMKRAMVTAYEAGLFDEAACGMPCLTVHDELDWDDQTDPDSKIWEELQYVMENSMPELSVPVKMDMGTGPTWGQIE